MSFLNSSSTGLYYKSLQILIRDFDIKSLVDVGSKGFMATGTSTVIIFAQKRKASFIQNLIQIIDQFFLDKKDVVANGISNAFSTYLQETYEGVSFEDFQYNVSQFSSSEIIREKERLLDFILTYPQILPVIKSGSDNTSAQNFLGYKFSNRQGNEGMHLVGEGKLYSRENKDLQENKANAYIYKSFLGNLDLDSSIHPDLKAHIFITRLSKLLSWNSQNDWRSLRLTPKVKIVSQYPILKLGEILKISKGKPITKEEADTKGSIPVVAGGQTYAYFHNQFNINESVITVSASGAYAGFVSFHNYPIWASDCMTLVPLAQDKLNIKYIFYSLKVLQILIYSFQKGSAQPHVYAQDLSNLSIPIPSKEKQDQIVIGMGEQEKFIENYKKEIKQSQEVMKLINIEKYPMKKLLDLPLKIRAGGDVPSRFSYKKTDQFSIPIYSNGVGSKSLYGYTDRASIHEPSLTISARGTIGYSIIRTSPFFPIVRLICITPEPNTINIKYLKYAIDKANLNSTGATIKQLTVPNLKETKIPLPSPEEQEKIVSQIEEQELLIVKYKEKIQRAKDQQKAIMSEVFTVEED